MAKMSDWWAFYELISQSKTAITETDKSKIYRSKRFNGICPEYTLLETTKPHNSL